jgi:predicted transposase YdaD
MNIARQLKLKGRREVLEEGMQRGMKKRAYAMATNMLQADESDAKIRQCTELSLREIQQPKKQTA